MPLHHLPRASLVTGLCAVFLIAGSEGAEPGREVPLEILEPAMRAGTVHEWPTCVGLVFPEGELPAGSKFALLDERNQHVPFESEVTGWWSAEKKNIRWLLLHFKASADRSYRFVPGLQGMRPAGRSMAIASAGGGLAVNTGPLQVKLTPRKAMVLDSASLNGHPVLVPSSSLFEMEDDEGRALGCEDWKLTLEVNTPLRCVVKAEGTLRLPGQEPMAKLLVRYQFFSGESFVRLCHTLIWIPQSLEPGANRIAIHLRPQIRDGSSWNFVGEVLLRGGFARLGG